MRKKLLLFIVIFTLFLFSTSYQNQDEPLALIEQSETVEIVIEPNPATTETELISFGIANLLEDTIELMCLPPEEFTIRDSLGEIVYHPDNCATIVSIIAPSETLFCAHWAPHETFGNKVPVGTYYVEMDYYLNLYGYIVSSSFQIEPPAHIKSKDNRVSIPETYSLFQNYPNPFNPTTNISFYIPGDSSRKIRSILTIHNLRGEQIRTLIQSELHPGNHRIIWDGKNNEGIQVSSGIYLLTLRIREKSLTRKMVLVK